MTCSRGGTMDIMGIAACVVMAVWIGSLIAICIFCRERSGTVIVNGRRKRNDDGDDAIFSDITDPAKSYLIENIYHGDGMSLDSDFDWQDTVEVGDDFSTSSMLDD